MNKLFTLLILALSCNASWADPIIIAQDLAQDAQVSQTQQKPIVFFVTANHCPYCELLREEYFQFSPNDERFVLRELELDEYHSVIGFDGKRINHQLLADRYDISLTPTVAFVGPDGEQLTDAIIGVLTMDFYGFYFEKALKESIAKLKAQKIAAQP